MIGRIRDLLRRWRVDDQLVRPYRPNELRLEVVRAERRQREMRPADVAAPASPHPSGDERAPRERAAQPVERRAASRDALARALQSRSSLRQAWVVKDVLDAPVALRQRHHGAEPPRPRSS